MLLSPAKSAALFAAACALLALSPACGKTGGGGGLKHPAGDGTGTGAAAGVEHTAATTFSAQAMAGGAADVGIVRGARDRVRIGDKNVTASVLDQIFGPDKAVAALTGGLIRANTGAFGGPCDRLGRLDGNNCGSHGSDSKAAVIPSSLATREGYRTRACEAVVQADAAIKFAAAQTAPAPAAGAPPPASGAGPSGADEAPTPATIAAAYMLFHPGLAPANDVVDALVAVADDPSNTTPLNAWRYVFLALCLAPDWQLL